MVSYSKSNLRINVRIRVLIWHFSHSLPLHAVYVINELVSCTNIYYRNIMQIELVGHQLRRWLAGRGAWRGAQLQPVSSPGRCAGVNVPALRAGTLLVLIILVHSYITRQLFEVFCIWRNNRTSYLYSRPRTKAHIVIVIVTLKPWRSFNSRSGKWTRTLTGSVRLRHFKPSLIFCIKHSLIFFDTLALYTSFIYLLTYLYDTNSRWAFCGRQYSWSSSSHAWYVAPLTDCRRGDATLTSQSF